MEVHEFGEKTNPKIVLIPGNLMTWRQFEDLIPLLSDDYYVIAISTDGYDGNGTTTFTTAQASADHLAAYLREKHDGRIDLVFGESMGCATALMLFHWQKVHVESMILNGAQNMDLGPLNSLLKKSIPKGQYKMARQFQESGDTGDFPLMAKLFIRQDEDKMKKMVRHAAKNISLESIQNATSEALSLFRTLSTYEPVPDAHVGFWHGSKEPNIKSAWKIIQQVYPLAQELAFEGFGHGEVMAHPDMLAKEIRRFMNGSHSRQPRRN